MNLNIDMDKECDSFIIKIHGDIDHHTSEIIRANIDNELILQKCRNIIFDFCGVNFMDSSGIGMIIGRYKRAATVQGVVVAIGVNDTMKKLFDLSGLSKIVHICKTLNEALDFVREGDINEK